MVHLPDFDGEYVVTRPTLTVGGITLKQGDRLPNDSPVRANARRLMLLIEQRRIRAVTQTVKVTPPKKTKATPQKQAPVVATVAELGRMLKKELVQLARDHDISTSGNKPELVKRIHRRLSKMAA